MKRLSLALGFLLGFTALAAAQVNVVPQVGVISDIVKQQTYSAVSIGLVPAASATDIFCISGSSTKAISIKRIEVSGIAGTAVSVPVTILRRVSLDTGGTPAVTTALPVAAPNFSTDSAATATLIAYTGNPTIVDASPVYLRSTYVSFPLTTGTVAPQTWVFGEEVGWFTRAINIPKGSTAQQYCVNLNATTITTGTLNLYISWVEN